MPARPCGCTEKITVAELANRLWRSGTGMRLRRHFQVQDYAFPHRPSHRIGPRDHERALSVGGPWLRVSAAPLAIPPGWCKHRSRTRLSMHKLPLAAHLRCELEFIRNMLATAETAMVAPADLSAATEAVACGLVAVRAVRKLFVEIEVSAEDRAFIEQHLNKIESALLRLV
jgi:hypothetical protein